MLAHINILIYLKVVMEILNINSNKGILTVKWSNKDALVKYLTPQRGCYFADLSNIIWESKNKFEPVHNLYFHSKYQERWSWMEELFFKDISDKSKIVDIGCGSSIIDLLLCSYVSNSTFYLVDKEGDWPTNLNPRSVSYSENHPFYHSWDIVEDAINTSGFDKKRFNFLNPENDFPDDIDLIMSSASWCWHYSKDQYWNRVMKSLKLGGKLFLDVRLLKDRDIIGEISEEFKSEPKCIKIPLMPEYLDNSPNVDPETIGYSCLWIKNA
jgi:hypothetical protein